jgi:hypothetical protein
MKRMSAVVAILSFAAAGGALACEYMDDSSAAAPAATKLATTSQQLPAATPAPKALRAPVAKAPQKPVVADSSEGPESKVKPGKPVVAALRN